MTLADPGSPSVAEATVAAGCSAPGFHEWDFWLGKWHISDATGHNAGEAMITALPGGCGFIETIVAPNGVVGESINVFDPVRGSWSQLWAAPGSVVRLEGKFERPGHLVTNGTISSAKTETPMRVTWEKRSDDQISQLFEIQSVKTGQWTKMMEKTYSRR
jgi:hypothetical protein